MGECFTPWRRGRIGYVSWGQSATPREGEESWEQCGTPGRKGRTGQGIWGQSAALSEGENTLGAKHYS